MIAAGPAWCRRSRCARPRTRVIDADLDRADRARAEHLASGRAVPTRAGAADERLLLPARQGEGRPGDLAVLGRRLRPCLGEQGGQRPPRHGASTVSEKLAEDDDDRLRHAAAAAAGVLDAQRPAHRRVRRQRVLHLRRVEEFRPVSLVPCADLPRAGRRHRTGLGASHHPPGRGRGAARRRLRRRRRTVPDEEEVPDAEEASTARPARVRPGHREPRRLHLLR